MVEIEIERKWLLDKFPDNEKCLTLFDTCSTEQSYISINPEVRLTKHTKSNNDSTYKITIKTDGIIKREEIPIQIDKLKYDEILNTLGLKPIRKNVKIYLSNDKHKVIVSEVEHGEPSSFIYAEIEFDNEEDAESYIFPIKALDVTLDNNYKMKNYWKTNR